MKTISIINLKGGVGKTVSAVNIAYGLHTHGHRVLVVDCDKQGNASKFFGRHGYNKPSIAEVLLVRGYDISGAIQKTDIDGVDILPANMTLMRANREILADVTRPQQTRFRKALDAYERPYDYCVIDCAPDINMAVINALVASDEVMIPVKVDAFTLDGMAELLDQISDIADDYNQGLRVAGYFFTVFYRSQVCAQAIEEAEKRYPDLHRFRTAIRRTTTVDQSTFAGLPLQLLNERCTAAVDYAALVKEYLNTEMC